MQRCLGLIPEVKPAVQTTPFPHSLICSLPFALVSEVVSLLDLLSFPYMVSSSSSHLFSSSMGDYRNEREIANYGLIVSYQILKK